MIDQEYLRTRKIKVFFDKIKKQPLIKFANRYISEAGFNVGDKVSLEYREGEIIIRKEMK